MNLNITGWQVRASIFFIFKGADLCTSDCVQMYGLQLAPQHLGLQLDSAH